MKKLFSLGVMLTLVMTLIACQDLENLDVSSDIASLQQSITSLENALEGLEEDYTEQGTLIASHASTIATLTQELEALKSQLEALEDTIFDGRISFILHTADGFELRTAPYKEADELNAFDLLITQFDVGYSTGDWGVFLERINTLDTQYGNFISIVKNGQNASSGIDTLAYTDGDVIEFKLVWWDTKAKDVHEGIHLFVDHQADAFLDDYLAILGLSRLGLLGNYSVELSDTMPTDVGGLLKRLIMLEQLELDYEATLDDLMDLADPTVFPYTSSLVYLAISGKDHNDVALFEADYLETVMNYDITTLDLDTLSLIGLALSAVETSDSEVIDFRASVKTQLTSEAFNNSYGNNAAGFANIILALVALDQNPFDVTEEEVSIVHELLLHQADNGAFYYTLDSDNVDLMFSTPQAFLALVAVELYLNQGATNVFTD